jgi:uncharacterized coiled-coil protein SlyX
MCGNRVEELESRVKELEASVEGLTDELVECKVRLRELENAVDDDLGFVPESETETQESDDDIRVPEAGESPDAAEASNTEAVESQDDTEESETDIIVA